MKLFHKITFCIFISIILFLNVWLYKRDIFDRHLNLPNKKLYPINCIDRKPEKYVSQHGKYFVINNFVRSSKTFKCNESITYTTQADYTFLENVPILVSRWMGPISISLFAPGDDFLKTLESIAYLRICCNEYIKQFVTFHVYFPDTHLPFTKSKGGLIEAYEDVYNCTRGPPFENVTKNNIYRRKNKIFYPINIGRNIARQLASTHYVLCSDIELYPSPNFIHNFLNMITSLNIENNTVASVYPIAVFELVESAALPENKTSLQKLFKKEEAFWFHKRLCLSCHILPKEHEWLAKAESNDFYIFTTVKRKEKFQNMEAFYVGTKSDPLFDERLYWEGQSNKMQQAYAQCLLNYDYKLLSNAFLVHKPEIKKVMEQWSTNQQYVLKTNQMIKKYIMPQMNKLYGQEKGCYLK